MPYRQGWVSLFPLPSGTFEIRLHLFLHKPLRLQRRPRSFHQLIVRCAGAAKIEDAGGQIAVAPHRADVSIIFQHRGAELVIMRVAALQEDQQARGIDEALRLRIVFEVSQDFACGQQAVVGQVGENLFDGFCPRGSEWCRFELIDPRRSSM